MSYTRCDVMCCDVQCCAVLCCVVFRRAVCNQIVILRFVKTHRRPPVDIQTQLDELPKASWDLLCSLCFRTEAQWHKGITALSLQSKQPRNLNATKQHRQQTFGNSTALALAPKGAPRNDDVASPKLA